MPVIVEPYSDETPKVPPKRIIVLMKKVIDINSPSYTAFLKEVQELYSKGVFDEILLLRDDDETLFKVFEKEYVAATLKDVDYLKQKINALAKVFATHKQTVDNTLDYLKGELFNVKGKVYYLEEEVAKQKSALEEVKKGMKVILDLLKRIIEKPEAQKLMNIKAKLEK